jgi:F-type H+-transporting ATPase subunit delta
MGKTVQKRHPASSAYSKALLEVGEERGLSETFAEQLTAFAAAIESDRMLRVFFESPKIAVGDKKAALERALTDRLDGAVLNLIKMLIDRSRQALFGEIADVFGELLDDARGRTHVQIVAARPISDSSRDRLVSLLSERLGREIITESSADADLLGGMTVRFGDTVIDGSLRTKLKHVRDAMIAPRLGRNLLG